MRITTIIDASVKFIMSNLLGACVRVAHGAIPLIREQSGCCDEPFSRSSNDRLHSFMREAMSLK